MEIILCTFWNICQIMQHFLGQLLFIDMNHIDLIGAEHKQPPPGHASKAAQKRPQNISVSKVFSNNHKWKECKIIGKNISIRSYSAACSFQKRLYLYGGYQILNGSLHDFYSISLDQSEPTFVWKQIVPKGEDHPRCRTKHVLLSGKDRIYLIGGLKANNEASNDIFEFNPATEEWRKLKPEGVSLPPIESFGAVLINGAEEKIVIAFGFNESTASYSNAVYEYSIAKNKLSVLVQGTEKESNHIPSPRIGCALATDNANIFVFGGKDESNRLNDIWSLSLTDYKFKRLKDEGEIPAIRNGHTMTYYQGKLYVFGGIHDITWELDDLHIYDVHSNKWTTLEQDSPRKVSHHKNAEQQQTKSDAKGSKKKIGFEKLSNFNSPQSFSITYNEDAANRGESPGKMLQQQRKKVFYLKKAEMLKNFQIPHQQVQKLVILQTSSQAMKNSLDVIGNPDPKIRSSPDKITDFGKETVSKFLQPLQNNSNIVIGKKPCARDGHCSVIIDDELVIFGGDRHQMSFNDIYKLNLKMAEKDMSG